MTKSSPNTGTLADLRPQSHQDPTDILRRWRLPVDDLNARAIADRLGVLWQSWTFQQRLILLTAAENVATAEAALHDWMQGAEQKRRYKLLAHQCKTAMRLAEDITRLFPPPWKEAHEPVRQLIASLVDFAGTGLEESAVLDHNIAGRLARSALHDLRRKTPRGGARASWALVGELAWLAGGKRKRQPCDESTIRRYARTPNRRILPPGADSWRRVWNALKVVMPLLSSTKIEHRFTTAARDFLRRARIR